MKQENLKIILLKASSLFPFISIKPKNTNLSKYGQLLVTPPTLPAVAVLTEIQHVEAIQTLHSIMAFIFFNFILL